MRHDASAVAFLCQIPADQSLGPGHTLPLLSGRATGKDQQFHPRDLLRMEKGALVDLRRLLSASRSWIPRGSGSRGEKREAASPSPGVQSWVLPPGSTARRTAASRPSFPPPAQIKAPCEGLGNSCLVM